MKAHAGVMSVSMLVMVSGANAALVTATWIGPGDGNWSESAKWSRVGVPNNGGGNTYQVVIDSGGAYSVVLNQNATIDTLTIGADDSLSFSNDRDLAITVGPITNEGLVTMNSTGNSTELLVGANMTMTGSGEWALGDHAANVFRNNFGIISRLTNGPDHTISGAGQIGINTMFFTNNGLVDANQPTAMQFDLQESQTNVNSGIMQASLGGTLNLFNSGTFDNTGGVIQALNGSVVNLINTGIVGGIIDSEGTGRVRPSVSVPSLTDLTILGVFQHTNDLDCAYAGTITNEGSIRLESAGNSTEMRLHTALTTFTGSGSIDMDGSINNVLRNNFGVISRLVNDVDHTIRGTGQIGINTIYMTNDGLIDADLSGQTLQFDLQEGQTNINNGTLQASNGGTMTLLNSGTIDNTNGVIQALDGSVVSVQNMTILGGLLHSQGSGRIHPSASPPAFQDVANTGVLEHLNDQDAAYIGTTTNDGTIRLSAAGNSTEMRLHSALTTFTGTGSVEMNNGINNIFRNNFGVISRLHNDVDHTIRGAGQIGINTILMTNDGLIEATQPTVLQFDLREEEENVNNGTLRARDGGTMNLLNSGIIDNTNGVIEALDGSVVNLMNTHIRSGNLDTAGSGVIRGSNSIPLVENVTNNGLLQLLNDQDIIFSGTISNNGVIEMSSTANVTEIRVHTTPTIITGPGEIVMSNHTNNWFRNNFGAVTQLVNGADHTIRGSGQIGLNTIGFVNNGTIISDASAGIVIDPRNETGGFVNNGLLHVTGDGGVLIQFDGCTNTGQVTVDATRKLTRNGDYVQTSGVTSANGEVQVDSGSFLLQGGVLNGDGLVDANVINTGGSIEPGNSIESLAIEGNFTQSHGAALVIEIENPGTPGVDHDVLTVTGTASLGGLLRLESFNGYVPSIGDTFTVLTAASRIGRFEGIIPCGTYDVTYTPTSVIIEVVGGPPVFADLSCDGDADLQDAGFLCLQLGLTDADAAFNPAADLNNDGVIDYDDRALMEGVVAPCLGDIVTSATVQPPADLVVDGADLAYLLGQWGVGLSCADMVTSATLQPPPDGIVDGADLAVLIGAWGVCN